MSSTARSTDAWSAHSKRSTRIATGRSCAACASAATERSAEVGELSRLAAREHRLGHVLVVARRHLLDEGLEHVGDEAERTSADRVAAAAEHEHVVTEVGHELVEQTGLAHAGVTEHERDGAVRAGGRARRRGAQRGELLVASDERRVQGARFPRLGVGQLALEEEGLHGQVLALHLVLTHVGQQELMADAARGLGRYERLRLHGLVHQSCGGVDRVAHHPELRAVADGAGDDQAGVDADVHQQWGQVGTARRPRLERGVHLERGERGALGLVLVRDRRAEDRADGVADELLDVAVVLADDGRELGHRLLHDRVGFFGIELLGHRGEARHVGEQRGDAATLAFGEAEARPHVAALGRRCGRRWLHEALRCLARRAATAASVSHPLRQRRDRLGLLAHCIGEGAQRREVRFGPACVERRGSLVGQLFGRAQRSASVLGGWVERVSSCVSPSAAASIGPV